MDNKAIPFPMEGEKIFEFNLTPEPTILAKLDEFITLSHVRHFAAAETLFDESLKAHLDKALVVEIEYADHLLQQGNYAHLSKFLDERISLRLERGIRSEKQAGSLSLDPVLEEELHLFGVIKALSDLLGVGALRQALAQAQRCKELLARATRERFPSNIQIFMFEMYLGIVAFGLQVSNWVTIQDLDPPWVQHLETANESGTPNILLWFKFLLDHDFAWEASRVLRGLLPVLHLLPSDEVNRTVFADEQKPRSHVEEDGPSGRLAAISMDLTRASFLLDSMIRDYGTRFQSGFGFHTLYAKGRSYLQNAENQLGTLGFSGTGLHSEIELEKVDYDDIQDTLTGGRRQALPKPSGDFKFPDNIEQNDGRLRRHFRMQSLTRYASFAVKFGVLVQVGSPASSMYPTHIAVFDESLELFEFGTDGEDVVSCFRLWSCIATVALYTSIHMLKTNSAQPNSEQSNEMRWGIGIEVQASRSRGSHGLMQILDSSQLLNPAEAKRRAGVPGSGSRQVIPALLNATAHISEKLGVLIGPEYIPTPVDDSPADNAYSEIVATRYPIRFDVPLYLWTFTRIMQQLKSSDLFPISIEQPLISSRVNWQQIGTIAEASRESLPVPAQETLEQHEKKRLENNGTISGQTNTLVLEGGPYTIQGNMIVAENTRIIVKDSQGVTILGDLIVKGKNEADSMPLNPELWPPSISQVPAMQRHPGQFQGQPQGWEYQHHLVPRTSLGRNVGRPAPGGQQQLYREGHQAPQPQFTPPYQQYLGDPTPPFVSSIYKPASGKDSQPYRPAGEHAPAAQHAIPPTIRKTRFHDST